MGAIPAFNSVKDFEKTEVPVLNAGILKKVTQGGPVQPRQTGFLRSSYSSSVMIVEETIADMIEIRMQSLNGFNARTEELLSLHRQHEEAFQHQMNGVLEKLETARVRQLDTEKDYELLLQKERFERQTVISLMQRFKAEGTKVMNIMKESLQEAKAKWRAEVERNTHLTAQLLQYSRRDLAQGTVEMNEVGDSTLKSMVSELHTKFQILTRLLEEEDSIIVQLQQRNKALEKKVSILTQQRNCLLGLESQHVETEEFNTEYNNLLGTVCGIETNKNDMPLEQKVETLTCFTKMLLQRLQAERRQRLRVEEQAVQMASEHDQIVQILEARIKSNENSKKCCAPFYHSSVFCADAEKATSGALNHDTTINPFHGEEQLSPPWDQTEAEDATDTNGNNDDLCNAICVSVGIHGISPEHDKLLLNSPVEGAAHATLEAQLATVARNFQQSVEEWNALACGGGEPFCEKDLFFE